MRSDYVYTCAMYTKQARYRRRIELAVTTLVSLFLLLLNTGNVFATPAKQDQPKVLTFGVVPQQSALKLARSWKPLLQAVSARSGYQLEFRTTRDIPTFESRLLTGEYDFAYMNPYHYTVFSKTPGYQAIARERDKFLQGIIVVHKDSPAQSLADLQGSRLAVPAPAAFAASILIRAELNKRGIKYMPMYVGSHDSVYHTVTRGIYPGGGGIVRTLNALHPALRDQLRILWKTKQFTPHAITAHPRLPDKLVMAVSSAFIELDQSAAGRAALETLNMNGLQRASKEDWNDIRSLDIDLLDGLIKPR